MSTFPEPTPNEPEDSLAGEDVAPPSTDPLATENTPAPPAEWTGEPEEPDPPTELAERAIIGAPPIGQELFRDPTFDVQPQPLTSSAKNAFRISATSRSWACSSSSA